MNDIEIQVLNTEMFAETVEYEAVWNVMKKLHNLYTVEAQRLKDEKANRYYTMRRRLATIESLMGVLETDKRCIFQKSS